MSIETKRLIDIREFFKLNRRKFAEFLEIEYSYYYRMEKGDRPISDILMRSLADKNINVNWLLTGEGDMILTKDDLKEVRMVVRDEIENYDVVYPEMKELNALTRDMSRKELRAIVLIIKGLKDFIRND